MVEIWRSTKLMTESTTLVDEDSWQGVEATVQRLGTPFLTGEGRERAQKQLPPTAKSYVLKWPTTDLRTILQGAKVESLYAAYQETSSWAHSGAAAILQGHLQDRMPEVMGTSREHGAQLSLVLAIGSLAGCGIMFDDHFGPILASVLNGIQDEFYDILGIRWDQDAELAMQTEISPEQPD